MAPSRWGVARSVKLSPVQPAPKVPSGSYIRALVEHYDRGAAITSVLYQAPPAEDQVNACDGRQVLIRVRPDHSPSRSRVLLFSLAWFG